MGRFGMNTLARHDVRHGDASCQYSHPDFAMLRLGTLFVDDPKCIGPAMVRYDKARVPHGHLLLGQALKLALRSRHWRGHSTRESYRGLPALCHLDDCWWLLTDASASRRDFAGTGQTSAPNGVRHLPGHMHPGVPETRIRAEFPDTIPNGSSSQMPPGVPRTYP
jgi:hypothetical protein